MINFYVNKNLINKIIFEISDIFAKYGFELSLVGGSVRDFFLSKRSTDFDFTSNATPKEIINITKQWKDNFYNYGKHFGTIGIIKKGIKLEITTYRSEKYLKNNRKPKVKFHKNLIYDLMRRDFTINSMALTLPHLKLIDPFNGLKDLRLKILRTPLDKSKESLIEDPLRMIRAARFVSQLNVKMSELLYKEIKHFVHYINIISKERIRDELIKLIKSDYPYLGIDILVSTGLAKFILPEIYSLKKLNNHNLHKNIYQHSLKVLKRVILFEKESKNVQNKNFILRFSALMHDIGKPASRRFQLKNTKVSFRHHEIIGSKMIIYRMRKLKFDNFTIQSVAKLIELHMRFYGYKKSKWTDSAVRRYVHDAGSLLDKLHCLVKADVTGKNKQKTDYLLNNYQNLEKRILVLQKKEKLKSLRPDLNGQEIMQILKIQPGPLVGLAYNFLLNIRINQGPLSKQKACNKLITWWSKLNNKN